MKQGLQTETWGVTLRYRQSCRGGSSRPVLHLQNCRHWRLGRVGWSVICSGNLCEIKLHDGFLKIFQAWLHYVC